MYIVVSLSLKNIRVSVSRFPTTSIINHIKNQAIEQPKEQNPCKHKYILIENNTRRE